MSFDKRIYTAAVVGIVICKAVKLIKLEREGERCWRCFAFFLHRGCAFYHFAVRVCVWSTCLADLLAMFPARIEMATFSV